MTEAVGTGLAFADKDAVCFSGLVRFGLFLLRVSGAVATCGLAGLIRVFLAQESALRARCRHRVVLTLNPSYIARLTKVVIVDIPKGPRTAFLDHIVRWSLRFGIRPGDRRRLFEPVA